MVTANDVRKTVVGPSGRHVGVLAEVRGNCFRVRTLDDQIWVLNSAVWTVDTREVTLICEGRALTRYICDEPSLEVSA